MKTWNYAALVSHLFIIYLLFPTTSKIFIIEAIPAHPPPTPATRCIATTRKLNHTDEYILPCTNTRRYKNPRGLRFLLAAAASPSGFFGVGFNLSNGFAYTSLTLERCLQ